MATEKIQIELDLKADKAYKSLNKFIRENKKAFRGIVSDNKWSEKAVALNKKYETTLNRLAGASKLLKAKYADLLLEQQKFNYETIHASMAFRKYFGVLLSGMFVFNRLSRELLGFVRNSIKFYLTATTQNDTIAQSINGISAAWNFLRYSFVQTLGEMGVFDMLAKTISDISQWFQDLTPEQQKSLANFILWGGVLSGILSVLGEIGIFLLSMMALGEKFAFIQGIFSGIGSAASLFFSILKLGISLALKPLIMVFQGLFSLGIWGFALFGVLLIGWIANWKKTIKTLKDFVWGLVENIFTWFKNLFGGIIDAGKGFIELFKGNWKEGFRLILRGLAKVFLGTFDFLFNSLLLGLKTVVRLAIDAINGLIKLANKIPGIHIKTINYENWKWLQWKSNIANWATSKIDELFGAATELKTTQTTSTQVNNITVNVNTNPQMSYNPNFLGNIIAKNIASEMARRNIGG